MPPEQHLGPVLPFPLQQTPNLNPQWDPDLHEVQFYFLGPLSLEGPQHWHLSLCLHLPNVKSVLTLFKPYPLPWRIQNSLRQQPQLPLGRWGDPDS